MLDYQEFAVIFFDLWRYGRKMNLNDYLLITNILVIYSTISPTNKPTNLFR